MALWHKRVLIHSLIWVVATAGFLAFSLADDGPAGLIKGTPRRNVAAAFVIGGLGLHFLTRHLTRKRIIDGVPQVDERDVEVERKSSEIALGITVAGVFIGAMGLNDFFAGEGTVPANWLWFMAWSTMILSHLSQALTAVVMYSGVFGRTVDHAEG